MSLIAATLSISCSDALFGARRGGVAHISIAPRFTRENAAIYRALREFDLQVSSMRVVLVRPPSDTVKDTTVTISPSDTVVVVEMKVEINQPEELFTAALEMRSGEILLFSGTVNVVARAVSSLEAPPVLVPVWVGPGRQATRIRINQPDTSLAPNGTMALTASAFDANDVAVTDAEFTSRFEWKVIEANLGSVPEAGGSFTGAGANGVAHVVVRTPNLLADTIAITLEPQTNPTSIAYAKGVEIVDAGATVSAPATARANNGSPLPNAGITYVSRAANIATVNASGVITGVARGQAIIVASVTATPTLADSMLAVVAEPGGPVVLSSLERMRLPLDTTFTVSVFVDMRTSTKKLGSATLDVEWAPAQLTYLSHANGASVTPTVNSSSTGTGKLTLAMADVTGFSGRVEMLKITFKTTTTASTGALAIKAREVNATDYSDLLPVTVQVTHSLRTP